MTRADDGLQRGEQGPLDGTLRVPEGRTDARDLTVVLRVTNRSDEDVAFTDPDVGVPRPGMDWPASDDAYRLSLLLSFGHLELSVTDPAGRELRREPLATWVTPVPRPRLVLAPGDSVDVPVPIGAFYRLEPGRRYEVTVAYGEGDAKVTGRGGVTIS